MYLFFGGGNTNQLRITNQFITQVSSSIKNQFCQYCNKIPSTKIAFVPDLKHGFTCNGCQVKAVGNDYKNLGEKTLVSNEKLAETITRALINYQTVQSDSTQQVKDLENQVKNHVKSATATVEKIKGEVKLLKLTTENKLNEITKTSETQNSSILFEELNKKSKEKKPHTEEIIQLLCKKSLVNKKGLHFVDEELIENMNSQVDERVSTLKSEVKIKLKQLDQLTNWINSIEL